MSGSGERAIVTHELRLRVLAALRELAIEQRGSSTGSFRPPNGMKAFVRSLLADIDISDFRIMQEVITVMVEDGWINRKSEGSHYWRIGDQAPDPDLADQTLLEKPTDTADPVVTQHAEVLESVLRLVARQAVRSGNLENLLEILNDLQTRLDPQTLSSIQLLVMQAMQATAKPAEA